MEKLQFSKLNGNNYQMWKFKMELLLIEKELWDTVSEKRPAAPDAEWLKRDGKARARIGLKFFFSSDCVECKCLRMVIWRTM